jgi:cytochrome c oxidase cbb3-type subunit 3
MAENDNKEIDKLSGVETTGHEWDGLKELNNPAPRWWLWVFIITVIWSVGYWVVYPAWPTLSGHTKGSFGWTQYEKLKQEQGEIDTKQQAWLAKFRKASFADIKKDPELYEFARAGGAVAFKENCAACHGTGAEGRKGYPNLNDDDWLFGGSMEAIYKTLKVGIRSPHPDTRTTMMPAFGRDGILKKDEIAAVADYVIGLNSNAANTGNGAKIFAENCASCHGAKGEGNRDMGAPKLNDAIWLYGNDRKTVIETISNARAGVMPTWENRLNEDTLRQLTIYVHSLGGGE